MAATNIRGGQILDASVSLTADVTGTLPVGNGGTGATSITGAGIVDTTSAQTLAGPKTLTDPRINSIKAADGATILALFDTASAVNYIGISNRLAGSWPRITATGSDSNVGLFIRPTGAGYVAIEGVTGVTPRIGISSDDTNANFNLTAQGTGVVMANGVEVATIAGVPNVYSANVTVPANYSSYVADLMEIGSGVAYEVAANAVLEIG